MKKCVVIFLILTTITVSVSGCRTNPQIVEKNENGVAFEAKEELSSTEENQESVFQGIPERLTYSQEEENQKIEVDIPVYVSGKEMLVGTLKRKAISKDDICSILEPESTWIASEDLTEQSGAEQSFLASGKRISGKQVSRYICFFDGMSCFNSNTNGDEDIFPIDADVVPEDSWTEEQKSFVEDRRQYTEKIFEDMKMDYGVTWVRLYEYENILYVTLGLSLNIDGIVICDLSDIDYGNENMKASAVITLSGERISEFRVSGNCEIEKSEAVNLLSWSQINSVFEEEISGSDWSSYKLTEVKLEYLPKTDMTFVPVWSFYGEIEDGIEKPLLCLNGYNGKVEFQW